MSDAPHCYTLAHVAALLHVSVDTLERHRDRHAWLVELTPRIGRTRRYRGDLVDAYLRGETSPSLVSARAVALARVK